MDNCLSPKFDKLECDLLVGDKQVNIMEYSTLKRACSNLYFEEEYGCCVD